MKRYWPFMGAVGVAATVGLYGYVNRDPLYEEPETEEEYLEEGFEYEVEGLEEVEMPVPYATKDTEKGKSQSKRKQTSQNRQRKETKPKNQSSRLSFPQPSGLEETVEEDEEYPSYYIPPEERDSKTVEELKGYFIDALNEEDYRIAESYIDTILNHYDEREREKVQKDHTDIIIKDYEIYLESTIKYCNSFLLDGKNLESLKIKVAQMDVFFFQNSKYNIREEERIYFTNKGEVAIKAVEYCDYNWP